MNPASTVPASARRIVRIQSRLCTGGPARQTLMLSARLDPGRYSTLLVTGASQAHERDMLEEARSRGLRTRRIGAMRRGVRPLHDLAALFALWRLLRRERADIVHTHTAKAGCLGRVAARLAGVPAVVHTFHGHVFDGYYPRFVTRAFILAERILARLTDRILVLSPRQRADIVWRYRIAPPAKVQIVPLGLDLSPLAERPLPRGGLRREAGWPAAARVAGIVGRLAPIKDHATFLEAAALLGRNAPDLELRIAVVGDGEMREALESRAARPDLGGRVHFFGWRDELAPVYGDLDIAVLSSRNEGTPVAAMEAMAAGVPLVATDVGGVADVLAGCPSARLVPAKDPESLARAIEEALRNPPDAGSLERARRIVLDRYSQRRLVEEIDRLYRDLLGDGDAARVIAIPEPAQAARAA